MTANALYSLVPEAPGRAQAASVERAMLRAWPAAEERILDGCLLRFSEGYTRRANCATAYSAGVLPAGALIAACEDLYREHALPPIFRLTSPWPQPALDEELACRGYALMDVTHVLALRLADWVASPALARVWHLGSLENWVDVCQQITSAPQAQRGAHLRILHGARGHILACTGPADNPWGCALGIVGADTIGLFDIAVRPDKRRQGLASALVSALLNAGKDRGTRWAYLQVTAANDAARRLYERFGLDELYRYWYRQQAAAGA
ncbi:MAG: GNAT family N-acetyltransferase [Anaerolineae bacterium]